jgi:hypothetical protein
MRTHIVVLYIFVTAACRCRSSPKKKGESGRFSGGAVVEEEVRARLTLPAIWGGVTLKLSVHE